MTLSFCYAKKKVKSRGFSFSEHNSTQYSSRKPSSFFWKSFLNPTVLIVNGLLDMQVYIFTLDTPD